jgi:hypothetical protein
MSLGEAAEAGLAVTGHCAVGHRYDIPLRNLIDLVGRFVLLDDALARHSYCPSCGALTSRFEIVRHGADSPS